MGPSLPQPARPRNESAPAVRCSRHSLQTPLRDQKNRQIQAPICAPNDRASAISTPVMRQVAGGSGGKVSPEVLPETALSASAEAANHAGSTRPECSSTIPTTQGRRVQDSYRAPIGMPLCPGADRGQKGERPAPRYHHEHPWPMDPPGRVAETHIQWCDHEQQDKRDDYDSGFFHLCVVPAASRAA
jgi:hypothetical protein